MSISSHFQPNYSNYPSYDQIYFPYPPSPTDSSQSTGSDFSNSTSNSLPPYSYTSYTSHSVQQAPFTGDSAHARSYNFQTISTSGSQKKPSSRHKIAHPYARLFAKKDEVKRRKIWNHVLEKSLFTPYELSTLGAPHRRTMYIASLEAHIDRLHTQLLETGYWPVAFSELEPFKGLNSKTAKSMVAGLQHDASVEKLKLLELERANNDLRKILQSQLHSQSPHASHFATYTLL